MKITEIPKNQRGVWLHGHLLLENSSMREFAGCRQRCGVQLRFVYFYDGEIRRTVEMLRESEQLHQLAGWQQPVDSYFYLRCQLNSQPHYALFANNCKTGAKWWQNNVRRIVYKRHLPCFANRFFAVHCTQDLLQVAVSSTNTKYFFVEKKSSARENWRRTTNSVQQHVHLIFANNILFGEKIISFPIRYVRE